MQKSWLQAEHVLLAKLCKEGKPISKSLHLFPGRTLSSLYGYMKAHGLRKKRMEGRDPYRASEIEAMLAKREMFAFEIAAEWGVTLPTVRPLLDQLHSQKKIYIAERVLLGPTVRSFRWALGDKPDAPMLHASKRQTVKKPRLETVKVETAVNVRRDTFIAAFYGEAA